MKKFLSLLACLLFSAFIFAQSKPAFWDDIERFKETDNKTPPPRDAILLVGSSSFTMWQDVADYFPGKTFINRGFGGSSLLDLNFYSVELLKPYQPKQIIIYCGENDFASNPNLKPRQVYNRFRHFFTEIRKYHPDVPVAYVSTKLSPSRKQLWPKFIATNTMIRKFMERNKNTAYIDITKAMNGPDGTTRSDLFLADLLHMKPEGYRIWAKEIQPYLK
ncbi:G-D-S-L family lipolytic protein [Chryseobacterium sp. 6424]|uniref:GDSL-type esterase/lipase family protein n=1 Tax=Chryseobacterium sp. 6424 TaxID=2039166 RepID=UPI000EFD39C8|nr:GDSL-type esterase/lipase family protein [Chryseobacterium sp. 6424]AYO57291.1 G-D-S-L family lipolytic protein [Chryseobacterium sp. 6424]